MKSRLFVAMLVLIFSGIACAADEEAFTAADTNQDGVLDEAEAQAVPGLVEETATIDANADGQIDAAEFSQFEIKPAE